MPLMTPPLTRTYFIFGGRIGTALEKNKKERLFGRENDGQVDCTVKELKELFGGPRESRAQTFQERFRVLSYR